MIECFFNLFQIQSSTIPGPPLQGHSTVATLQMAVRSWMERQFYLSINTETIILIITSGVECVAKFRI